MIQLTQYEKVNSKDYTCKFELIYATISQMLKPINSLPTHSVSVGEALFKETGEYGGKRWYCETWGIPITQ